MIENRYELYDANNNKYVVFQTQEGFTCKKVLPDNTLIDPTTEELTFIIEELKKLKQSQVTLTYDNALIKLKELIDNGTLNSLDEIKNYVNSLNLNENDKEKLIQASFSHLESKSKVVTPVTQLKNKIIEHLRKERKEGNFLIATFTVIDNVTGPSYCKISLDSIDENSQINLEMESLDYNDELKKDLIEPVIEEIVLSSEVEAPKITPVPGGFYRSNLNLASSDNKITNLNNIEEEYARKLDQHIKNLMTEAKIQDHGARDTRINELQEERNLELDNTRKRIKPEESNDKKGFSNNYLIYGVISLTTALLIILQIFALS